MADENPTQSTRPAAPGASAPGLPPTPGAAPAPVVGAPVVPSPAAAPVQAGPVRAAAPGPPDPPAAIVPEVSYEFTPPRRSAEIKNLAMALAKAQKALKPALKTSENPFFSKEGRKATYADLAAHIEAAKDALADNDLAVLQPASAHGQLVCITTILVHGASGEFIEQDLVMKAQQGTPQGLGSTTTYARRYGFSAMVGTAPEDDDGNTGSSMVPPGVKQDAGKRSELQKPQTVTEPQGSIPAPSAGGALQQPAAPVARPSPGPPPPPPGAKPPAKAPGA
jgi:hypothetical protein